MVLISLKFFFFFLLNRLAGRINEINIKINLTYEQIPLKSATITAKKKTPACHISLTLLIIPKSNNDGILFLLPTSNTIQTEAQIPLFDHTNKVKIPKIDIGIKILQNIEIFGWMKRLAPAASVLPNSFSKLTKISG